VTEIQVWEGIKLAAEVVTAGCTVGSAAAWGLSAKARVPVARPGEQIDDDGWEPAQITGRDDQGQFDRLASLDEQTRLSAIAAAWAAGASIGLAVVTFINIFVL